MEEGQFVSEEEREAKLRSPEITPKHRSMLSYEKCGGERCSDEIISALVICGPSGRSWAQTIGALQSSGPMNGPMGHISRER